MTPTDNTDFRSYGFTDFRSYGFAPGNYFRRCQKCEGTFEGDKRATTCYVCALEASQTPAQPAIATPTDHTDLRDLALAATQGWGKGILNMTNDEMKAVTALRAACHPDRIIGLVEECAELRRERDEALRMWPDNKLPAERSCLSGSGVHLMGDRKSIDKVQRWEHEATAVLPAVWERYASTEARAEAAEARVKRLEEALERIAQRAKSEPWPDHYADEPPEWAVDMFNGDDACTCGYCGAWLTVVRPGKHQCDNCSDGQDLGAIARAALGDTDQ